MQKTHGELYVQLVMRLETSHAGVIGAQPNAIADTGKIPQVDVGAKESPPSR